jgi:NitT/TauT family transport system substrate-binding protein
MKLRRWMAAVCAIAALGAAGCGSDDDDTATSAGDRASRGAQPSRENPTNVSVAIASWVGYAPIFLADQQGLDKRFGVDLQLRQFQSTEDYNAAVTTGRVDFATAATDSLVKYLQNDAELKVLMVIDQSRGADALIAKGDVRSVADLRGKKVGYKKGQFLDPVLLSALDSAGLTEDDIDAVPLEPADAATALIAGRVDAALTYEPYITKAKSRDRSVRVLFSTRDAPGIIQDPLVVQSRFAQANPRVVEAVLAMHQEAVRRYRENPTEAQEAFARISETPVADLKPSFDGVKINSLEDAVAQLRGPFASQYEKAASFLQRRGVIDEIPDVRPSLDPSFAERVLRR